MKLGRNDPCHCGSGKKYKQCCLEKDEEAQIARAAIDNERRAEYEQERKAVLRAEREHSKSELRRAMNDFIASGTSSDDQHELGEAFDEDWGEEEWEGNGNELDSEGAEDGKEERDEDEDSVEEFAAELEEEQENDDFDDEPEDENLGQKSKLSPEEKQKRETEEEALRAEAKIFWEQFERKDLRGKIEIYASKLAEPKPVDDYLAFEMLKPIYEETITNNARELYEPLIAELRQTSPRAYKRRAEYYLANLIANAIVAQRDEDLPALVQEIARTAGRSPDIFHTVLAQLGYHGRLHILNEALRRAWPVIRKSTGIVPWAINDYGAEGVRALVFDYIERHGAPAAGDAALFKAIRFFAKVPQDRIDNFIALMSGHDQREWRAEDFDFKKRPPKPRKPEATPAQLSARENLISLSMKFQGYAHRTRNMPYCKIELGRESLVKYVFMRLNGDLKPRQSMIDAALRPKPAHLMKDPPYHPEWPVHARVLCLHPNTLERFIVRVLHFLNPQHYKLAALFEILPVWLEFLVEQKLAEPIHQETTLQEMRRLHDDLLKVFEAYPKDPALYQTHLHWPEQNA